MQHEEAAYVADSAHWPYGPWPIVEVRPYALDCLKQFITTGIKMLVII